MEHRAPSRRGVFAPVAGTSVMAASLLGTVGVVVALGGFGTLGCEPKSQGPVGSAVTGNSELPDPDLARFWPDIPNIYDGDMEDPGLRVVAHTIREVNGKNQYLVAIQNTGTDPICMLELSSTFTDSAGNTDSARNTGSAGNAGSADNAAGNAGSAGNTGSAEDTGPRGNVVGAGLTPIRTPLYHTTRQMGLSTLVLSTLIGCLGPGEIGMGQDTEILEGVYLGMIGSVRHDFSGISQPSVVPADDVGLSGLRATTNASGFPVFSGSVENGTYEAIDARSISVFALNSLGRPVAVTEVGGPGIVEPGNGRQFALTGNFSDDFDDFAVYLDASNL